MSADGFSHPCGEIRLIPAEECDLGSIRRLDRISGLDEWSREGWQHCFDDESSLLIKAQSQEGLLVGYILARTAAKEVEIHKIAVDPECRRQGVAQTLLDMVLKTAAGKGANVCYLEVREKNSQAIAFYRKNGFRRVGRRRAYYRSPVEDALIMRRALSAG